MRVLFIGGTGNISTACVQRAVTLGQQVTVLNRGRREAHFGRAVEEFHADRNDPSALSALGARHYDVVANFLGFQAEQVEMDLRAFDGQVGQYLFVSTASAYRKPPTNPLITESTPLGNPFWPYARDKIACEARLMRAFGETGFPVTIVRPSYTVGPTWIPSSVGGHGYTVVGRMRRGQPIISHGDGQSLWGMTSSDDFAVGFVGLFGREQAIGEAYHITSDEVLTWDGIYHTIARAAGVQAEVVHIPSELIATMVPRFGPGLLGDKMYSTVQRLAMRGLPRWRRLAVPCGSAEEGHEPGGIDLQAKAGATRQPQPAPLRDARAWESSGLLQRHAGGGADEALGPGHVGHGEG